jgi:hypothetical protein
LVEEGFVGVVPHDPRQTQAFDCFLLTLYWHGPPAIYRPATSNRSIWFWQNWGRPGRAPGVLFFCGRCCLAPGRTIRPRGG